MLADYHALGVVVNLRVLPPGLAAGGSGGLSCTPRQTRKLGVTQIRGVKCETPLNATFGRQRAVSWWSTRVYQYYDQKGDGD